MNNISVLEKQLENIKNETITHETILSEKD